MGGASKVTGVQDAVPVDQDKLGVQLGTLFAKSIEKHLVRRHLLEGQKTRYVRIISRVLLKVLIQHPHAWVFQDDQGRDCLLLIILRVADIHSADSFKCRLALVL